MRAVRAWHLWPRLRGGRSVLARALLGLPLDRALATGRSGSPPLTARLGVWWARHPRLLHAFAVIALCWSVAYLSWRLGFSWKGANPELWWILLLAELYGCWNLATLTWLTWDVRSRHVPKEVGGPGRSVDVYVCTYDEPAHVLEATLAGCALLSRPHTTYVLDDGRREEIGALATQWGAIWMTRPDNAHAKAGNINHALPLTHGELVFVLDADHVPLPDALDTLVSCFEDRKVALVQSPHDFSNHDSIQHYDLGRHEQSLFFSVVCPGKDRHNAAFWCGSGALIRRDALLGIGGVATETIAEDFHTTIKLHRAGWRSRYEPRTVVQGRAPHDLAAYLLQRDRWARGNLAVFRTPESPLRARGLTFAQRLSYLASLTSYFAGPVRLLLLGTLTAVLWTGALPLHISAIALGVLWAPATLLSIFAGTALCRGLQGAGETSHFELCTAEIFTRALRCVVRPGRTTFRVTPKEGVDHGGWEALRQFRLVLLLATLLGAGVLLRIAEDLGLGFLPPMHRFAAWFVPLLGVIELRRMLRTMCLVVGHRQLRTEYRAPLEVSALVELQVPERTPLLGRVHDITPSGIGFELAKSLPEGTAAKLSLQLPAVRDCDVTPIELNVEVRSCAAVGESWRVGASIVGCSEEDRRRIVEYCFVIWPYRRLHGQPPQLLDESTLEPIAEATSGLLSVNM